MDGSVIIIVNSTVHESKRITDASVTVIVNSTVHESKQ
jgi:hypothetical protein